MKLGSRTRRGARLAALLGAAVVAWPLAVGARAQEPGPRELLPDLQQAPPSGVQVISSASRRHPRFLLVFGSTTDNDGEGPLIVNGHRPNRQVKQMTADQIIQREDGSTTTVPGVGKLQYVVSPDHQHWHFLHYDRYELRSATGFARTLLDRKSGFCVGDRGPTGFTVPSAPPAPVYTDECRRNHPGIRSLTEGLSPGYYDYYGPFVEGQYLDITGLHSGRYYLVHRVNAAHTIVESDYGNNASGVLLSLVWPGGHRQRPRLRVVRECPNGTAC